MGELEFLRFAFLSRAVAEQNQKLAAEAGGARPYGKRATAWVH